jgi:hypothetical protein
MGDVISIREAQRVRRRREASVLNARCRALIVESLQTWRTACACSTAADRVICLERIHVLGELLAYADRLG